MCFTGTSALEYAAHPPCDLQDETAIERTNANTKRVANFFI